MSGYAVFHVNSMRVAETGTRHGHRDDVNGSHLPFTVAHMADGAA